MMRRLVTIGLLVVSANTLGEAAPPDPKLPRIAFDEEYYPDGSLAIPLNGKCEGLDGPQDSVRDELCVQRCYSSLRIHFILNRCC